MPHHTALWLEARRHTVPLQQFVLHLDAGKETQYREVHTVCERAGIQLCVARRLALHHRKSTVGTSGVSSCLYHRMYH